MQSANSDESIAVLRGERGKVFHTLADVNCILSVPTYETYSLTAAEFDGASIVTNGGPFPEVVPHAEFVDPEKPMEVAHAMEICMDPAYRAMKRQGVRMRKQQPTLDNHMRLSLEGLVSHGIISQKSYVLR